MESAWILLNKARSESLTNEHAGFLMGQGLNGHLSNLPTLSVHDYLIKVKLVIMHYDVCVNKSMLGHVMLISIVQTSLKMLVDFSEFVRSRMVNI